MLALVLLLAYVLQNSLHQVTVAELLGPHFNYISLY